MKILVIGNHAGASAITQVLLNRLYDEDMEVISINNAPEFIDPIELVIEARPELPDVFFHACSVEEKKGRRRGQRNKIQYKILIK